MALENDELPENRFVWLSVVLNDPHLLSHTGSLPPRALSGYNQRMTESLPSRASMMIIVNRDGAFEGGYRWLRENRDKLIFISENLGCGCCVDSYDLEGPPEVLATIPEGLRCSSDWASGVKRERAPENTDLDLYF